MFESIICFFLISIIGLILHFWKLKIETRRYRLDLLFQKWRTHRERRLLWKESHSGFFHNFDFNDPEYQELWNIEIGSQLVYIMALDEYGMKVHSFSSWWIYVQERDENEAEFD
ncbi:MAG TPA: hypothetical protein VJJ28_03085 [Candidatus Paceibacterota bacterium]